MQDKGWRSVRWWIGARISVIICEMERFYIHTVLALAPTFLIGNCLSPVLDFTQKSDKSFSQLKKEVALMRFCVPGEKTLLTVYTRNSSLEPGLTLNHLAYWFSFASR